MIVCRSFAIALISCCVSACAPRLTPLSAGVDTLTIYRAAEAGASEPVALRPITTGPYDLRGWSRSEADVLGVRFPLLPNPRLALYVFPHLRDGTPVPGYITTYRLYERDHHALPGE